MERSRPAAAGLPDRLLAMAPVPLADATVWLIDEARCRAAQAVLLPLLDDAERRRAEALRHPAMRQRYIAGRATLRCILSHLDGCQRPPASWRLRTDASGKPRLVPGGAPGGMTGRAGSAVAFSLAYAAGLIAIAVSSEGEVGVDLEACRPLAADDIPWHLLSRAERQALEGLPAAALAPRFYRLWVIKEAIAKARGLGFAAEFAAIDSLACEAEAAAAALAWRELRLAGRTYMLALARAAAMPAAVPA